MTLRQAKDYFERARINSKEVHDKLLADGLEELAKALDQRLNRLERRVDEVYNEILSRK